MKNEECGKYRIWSAGHSVAAVMGALVRSDLCIGMEISRVQRQACSTLLLHPPP